jgi:hypothetical protein
MRVAVAEFILVSAPRIENQCARRADQGEQF